MLRIFVTDMTKRNTGAALLMLGDVTCAPRAAVHAERGSLRRNV